MSSLHGENILVQDALQLLKFFARAVEYLERKLYLLELLELYSKM
jgi:hypothetical protein